MCSWANCTDSTEWVLQTDFTKRCDWVEDARSLRCVKSGLDTGETPYAFIACPNACQTCPNFGDCVDDPNWFKNGEPSKVRDSPLHITRAQDCDWVSSWAPRCLVKGVDGSFAYENCRVACGIC